LDSIRAPRFWPHRVRLAFKRLDQDGSAPVLADLVGMRRLGPITLSAAPLVISHPKLQALHAFWLQQRGGNLFATRSDFAFANLKIWLGHICLVEVAREPVRFRFRLIGTHVGELAGRDHTGRWLDSCFPSERLAAVLDPFYECLRRRAPVACAERYEAPNGDRSILEQLLLPCSADESAIDLIVGAVYLEAERAA
jgi:hypothetical protein